MTWCNEGWRVRGIEASAQQSTGQPGEHSNCRADDNLSVTYIKSTDIYDSVSFPIIDLFVLFVLLHLVYLSISLPTYWLNPSTLPFSHELLICLKSSISTTIQTSTQSESSPWYCHETNTPPFSNTHHINIRCCLIAQLERLSKICFNSWQNMQSSSNHARRFLC